MPHLTVGVLNKIEHTLQWHVHLVRWPVAAGCYLAGFFSASCKRCTSTTPSMYKLLHVIHMVWLIHCRTLPSKGRTSSRTNLAAVQLHFSVCHVVYTVCCHQVRMIWCTNWTQPCCPPEPCQDRACWLLQYLPRTLPQCQSHDFLGRTRTQGYLQAHQPDMITATPGFWLIVSAVNQHLLMPFCRGVCRA
jgi:hypothetical protein